MILFAQEFQGFLSVSGRAFRRNCCSETVLSVVLPNSLEVGLTWDCFRHFVWEYDLAVFVKFWSQGNQLVDDGLESFSALLGSGVQSEIDSLVLVSVSERIQNIVPLLHVHVALMSVPPWVWQLIVEQTRTESLSKLFSSEPVQGIWLNSRSPELHGSSLGVKVVESFVPSLSGINIEFPAVSALRGGPVWDSVALKDSSGSAIKGDVSDSLLERRGVEVLCVEMVHVVGLLVELLIIKVFDSDAYIIIN